MTEPTTTKNDLTAHFAHCLPTLDLVRFDRQIAWVDYAAWRLALWWAGSYRAGLRWPRVECSLRVLTSLRCTRRRPVVVGSSSARHVRR